MKMSTTIIEGNGARPDLQERLRDPATARALERILDHVDELARFADAAAMLGKQLPGGMAMFVDSADEIAGKLTANGVDIEKGLAHGAEAALRFGAFMGTEQVESIEALLRSGVLDPQAVNIVGQLGGALAATAAMQPQRAGFMRALGALRDPDVQRALGFLLAFAKRFGTALASPAAAGK
jgi:hypothetical protein